MIYTFLISIVFIAELVITITIIQNLVKLDKYIIEINNKIDNNKTSLNEVFVLVKKISKQYEIITQDFVNNIKENSENVLYKQITKILIGVLVLKLNLNFINKIKNSKLTKTIAKGLSLLEIMV